MTLDYHVEDADGRVERIAPRMIDTDAEARILASSAFAHVTDRPCRECDGTGWYRENDECRDCCGTGRELE